MKMYINANNFHFKQYLDLNTATSENLALHKYNMANDYNNTYLRKAFLPTSEYSSFMLFQNSKSDNEEMAFLIKN